MKLDNLEFFKIVELVNEDLSKAHNTSSYSDLLLYRVHPEVLKNGRKARIACLAISTLGLNPIQEITLKKQILTIANKYRYQGNWSRVKDILTVDRFTPFNVFEEHLKDRSLNDFYGNEYKLLVRICKTIKTYNPYIPSKRPVSPKQRKRGYDDKGHAPRTLQPQVREPAERLELPEIIPTNTSWWENLPIGRRENSSQETLVEKATSSSESRKMNSKAPVFLDSAPRSQVSKVETFDPKTHEQSDSGNIVPKKTSFFSKK